MNMRRGDPLVLFMTLVYLVALSTSSSVVTEVQNVYYQKKQIEKEVISEMFYIYPLPEKFWWVYPSAEDKKCPKAFSTRSINSGNSRMDFGVVTLLFLQEVMFSYVSNDNT